MSVLGKKFQSFANAKIYSTNLLQSMKVKLSDEQIIAATPPLGQFGLNAIDPLQLHAEMCRDSGRLKFYDSVFNGLCVKGKKVLVVGTGSCFIALRALGRGAEKVAAVEFIEELIEVAKREVAQKNLEQKATFFKTTESTDGWQPADIVIYECFHTLHISECFLDAIERSISRNIVLRGTVYPRFGRRMALLVECSGLTESAENQSIDPGLLNHLHHSAGVVSTLRFNFNINLFRTKILSAPFNVCDVDFHCEQDTAFHYHDTNIVSIRRTGRIDAVIVYWESRYDNRSGDNFLSSCPFESRGNIWRDIHWGYGIQLVRFSDDTPNSVDEGTSIEVNIIKKTNGLEFSFKGNAMPNPKNILRSQTIQNAVAGIFGIGYLGWLCLNSNFQRPFSINNK